MNWEYSHLANDRPDAVTSKQCLQIGVVALSYFLLVAASTGPKDIITGNDLVDWCGNDIEHSANGFCIGYLAGLVEGLVQMRTFCLPPNSNNEQYRRMILEFLYANPKKRNEPAVVLTHDLLTQSFPCTGQ